jgi:valyl-tRNA synthetase
VQASHAALSVLLRLLAPFLPFVTEEVWSWWQAGSVHNARWPAVDELARQLDRITDRDREAVQQASAITARIRHLRSTQGLGFGTPIRATFALAAGSEAIWSRIQDDVLGGNNIDTANVRFTDDGPEASIEPVPPHA